MANRGVPAVLAAVLLGACATAPTQTAFMKEQGVSVSADALRMRLRAQAVPFTGVMAHAADEAAALDPAAARRALVWKINVIPALYEALFDQRPLVGLLDTWALLVQAEDYLSSPEGKAAFGGGAGVMLEAARDLQRRLKVVAEWAAPHRDLASVEARLRAWAARHPVKATFSTRESIDDQLATVLPPDDAGLAALASGVGESLDGIVARLDFLPVMVPHQAIWQAELAYVDLVDPRMEAALRRGDEALRRVDSMVGWLGGPGLDAFADRQREALFDALDEERLAIESAVEGERAAVFAFATREREAAMAQVRAERIAAMEDLRRLVDQVGADAEARARSVVDHALWRLAAILAVAVVAGAALVAWSRRRPG
jgi:hypothetical protein